MRSECECEDHQDRGEVLPSEQYWHDLLQNGGSSDTVIRSEMRVVRDGRFGRRRGKSRKVEVLWRDRECQESDDVDRGMTPRHEIGIASEVTPTFARFQLSRIKVHTNRTCARRALTTSCM